MGESLVLCGPNNPSGPVTSTRFIETLDDDTNIEAGIHYAGGADVVYVLRVYMIYDLHTYISIYIHIYIYIYIYLIYNWEMVFPVHTSPKSW